MTTTFNREGFYQYLDWKRRSQGKTWADVGRESGVNTGTFTFLRRGYSLRADTLVALMAWLGETDLKPYMTAIERQHAVQGSPGVVERRNPPDAYPSEGPTVTKPQKACGCVGKCPNLFLPCPVCNGEVTAVEVDEALTTTYYPCKHTDADDFTTVAINDGSQT